MGCREELGRPETQETKKTVRKMLIRGKFAPLPQGDRHPWLSGVPRFSHEEFKVDEVKKVVTCHVSIRDLFVIFLPPVICTYGCRKQDQNISKTTKNYYY
jgi:gluconate kinase